MKVGVFTVGLPDLTPEEAVREIKDAGYDGVEWRVTVSPRRRGARSPLSGGTTSAPWRPRRGGPVGGAASEEAGLEIPGLGTYVAVGDLEAANEAMRFAATAGAPQVRVGAGAPTDALTKSYSPQPGGVSGRGRGSRQVQRGQGAHRDPPQDHLPERLSRPQARFGLRPDLVGVILDPGNMAQEGFEDYHIGAELLGPYQRTSTSRTRPSSGPPAVACGSRDGRPWRTVWWTSARSSRPSNT